MAFYTQERVVSSMRGYKKPLYSYRRVYGSLGEVKRRINHLVRDYGSENIVVEGLNGAPNTQVVYIRVN